MKLTASLIVYNELNRYLRQSLPALLSYCDHVCVWSDGSTDGTTRYLKEVALTTDKLHVKLASKNEMFKHEGQARQRLLEWTVDVVDDGYLLAIDADEFVAQPTLLTSVLTRYDGVPVVSLEIAEVWNVNKNLIFTREDGGWHAHNVPVIWRIPSKYELHEWEIQNRALACGRVPLRVHGFQAVTADIQLLHFGWTNKAEREKRFQRYDKIDQGNFHAKAHLDSILYPDSQIITQSRLWSSDMESLKAEILKSAGSDG